MAGVHLAISLERFAQLQAQLDEGTPRHEVLQGEELAPEVWERARAGWLQRMGEEAKRGRLQLAQVYQRAYVDCFTPARESTAAAPVARPEGAIDEVGGTSYGLQIDWGDALPFDGDAASAELEESSAEEEAAHPDVGATIAGGELKASDLFPFAPDEPVDESTTPPSAAPPRVTGAAPAPRAAPPVAVPPASSPVANRPAAEVAGANVDATSFGVSALRDEDVLPFAGEAEAPAPAPTPPAASEDVGGTVFGAKLDLGDAVPFDEAVPASAAAPADVEGTVFGAKLDLGDAIPFDGAAPAVVGPEADGLDARFGSAAVDEADVGGTAFGVRLDLGDAIPFEDEEEAPAATHLTLDQYAAFCVERRLWPDRTGEIVARYGVDAAREDAHHAPVLAQPEARAAFDEAAGRYEAWLRGRQT